MSERANKFSTAGLLADRKVTQLMAFTAFTFLVFSYFSSDIFFTPENFLSMAYQVPEIAILSIAVMLSMLTGGIDLSIVGISNASALIASYIMTQKVSDAVQSGFGWHLIQVTDRRSNDVSVKQKRQQAQMAIRTNKSDAAYQDWVHQLRDGATIEYRSE